MKPSMLYAKVTPDSLGIPNDVFFTSSSSEYQKYREAWAASLFARGFSDLIKPCEVRLVVNDSFPDFEIKVENSIHPFEFTEAQVPEYKHKRGDYYKKKKTDPLLGPLAIYANVEEAATWICDKLKKKFEKKYRPKPNLLIYANFQVAKKLDLDQVRKVCEPYRPEFKSVWLLWAVTIAQVFPGEDFYQACSAWSEIPGYRKECEKRMGIGAG